MSSSERRSYPRQVVTEAGPIEFRLMGAADEAAVLAFARSLPVHDLLFLPRNISEPKVLTAWVREIERGAITSVLAWKGDKVVGCGTIVCDPHSWSPHVGGIRMVISTDVRGLGVGRGGNSGEKGAAFEPIHGSAPSHAGKNEANPVAMILSGDSATRPVSAVMAALARNTDVSWSLLNTGIFIAIVPTLVLVVLVWRFVVEGLLGGAVKG